MQNEIMQGGPLLDESGKLRESGYAKRYILDYDRRDIKAASCRIKEWDYYLVTNNRFGIALTIADNSYMGIDSVTFLDFTKPWVKTKNHFQWLKKSHKNLSPTSEIGDAKSCGATYKMEFRNGGISRMLVFEMKNFSGGNDISGEIILGCPPQDSMMIATPFAGDPLAFYYNQKINCMPASGKVKVGMNEYVFNPPDSFGVLNWGRGIWPKNCTCFWASASGLLDSSTFGFNIGYGFGDTTAATENMIFYRGEAHKISNVTIHISKTKDKYHFMKPWTFTSDDGRFEMTFQPIVNRHSNMNAIFIASKQDQVFGNYSGTAVLDDGTRIEIENFFGFAEKVTNKW